MGSKKYSITSMVVVLSLLVSTSSGFAIGDDKNSQSSLRGLKKLSVVVQIEKPALDDFKKVGLTEDRIRTRVETKLQEAKIDVANTGDLATDTPILHVEVNGSYRNGKTFSFLIEIELWQKSILKRDPKVEMITGTWSTGVFGSGQPATIGNDIMGLINDMTDTFIRAYSSVNS